ncbi:MAG: MMPL family transporter [Polyangiales bacterium]
MFESLARFTYRRHRLVLLLAAVFLVGAAAMLVRGGTLTSGTIRGLESTKGEALVHRVLGHPTETAFVAVFRGKGDPGSEAFQSEMKRALAPLRQHPAVLSVTDPSDAGPLVGREMIARDGPAAFAIVVLRGDVKEALSEYGKVRAALHSNELEIRCTGHLPFMHDLDVTLGHDLLRAEIVSLPLALIVLLLVFRTAVAAVLPIAVGALSVAGGIAIVLAISRLTDMAQYTINVCSLIGLGVAVDYSLFMVSRYREELAAGHDYEQALVRAMAKIGRVIAFSGGAVGTGLAGLLFFEGSYLLAMGIGGAIVVALAVIFALTFLPALLAVLGPRIHAGKLPEVRLGPSQGFFHRVAVSVMRRPVLVLVPTLGALLVMGIPFLHLELGAADVTVLPKDSEAREGLEALRRNFPERAKTRVTVSIDFRTGDVFTPDRLGALVELSKRVRAIPGVVATESVVDLGTPMPKEQLVGLVLAPPPQLAAPVEIVKRATTRDATTLLTAIVDAAPQSELARSIVRTIRTDRRVADGTLLVSGETAVDLDATEYMRSRAPRAVLFVVSITLIVLYLLLGSLILPIKAVIMNFVSIAGSFGALVFIFQDGHLWVREGRPIEPTLPVLLFCILFGLSMDYEVLMLSRIKDDWERTGDNTHAVGEGLERTAGLITSAAAIMVAVFGAFALARVILIQAVGFGMALAVAIDATLVRMLLVPATMRLFGHLNWWSPRWMLSIRRAVGFEHTSH